MSSLLLDTNALIFCISNPKLLSKSARTAIDAAETLHISAASLWEIDIKHRQAPQDMPYSAREYGAFAAEIAVNVIAIDASIIYAIELLGASKHKDPFDRIIMATSKERSLPLVTKDAAIRKYLKSAIW